MEKHDKPLIFRFITFGIMSDGFLLSPEHFSSYALNYAQ